MSDNPPAAGNGESNEYTLSGLLYRALRAMPDCRCWETLRDEIAVELARYGYDEDSPPCESCCRPSTHIDAEGVPLCLQCWESLLNDGDSVGGTPKEPKT